MAEPTDPAVTPVSVVLWKDVWWVKHLVLAIFGTACLVFFQVFVAIAGIFKFGKRRELQHEIVDSAATTASRTVPPGMLNDESIRSHGESQQKCHVEHGLRNKDVLETNEEKEEQFYDLSHHGIQFYNDMSPSGRQRRHRMPSTVVDSMVSQRSSRTVLNPPAFPNISDDSINLRERSNMNRSPRLSTGDTRFSNPVKANASRLSTVMEEITQEPQIKSDQINYKTEQNPLQNCRPNAQSRDQQTNNAQVKDKPKQYGFETKECSKVYVKSPNTTCNNMPRPANADEHGVNCPSNNNHPSGNLECFVCKSKIQCLCQNCSLLSFSQKKQQSSVRNLKDATEDSHDNLPEIQEEFIDDNFEDMESIVSDDIVVSDDITSDSRIYESRSQQ